MNNRNRFVITAEGILFLGLLLGLVYPFSYCIFQSITHGLIKVPFLHLSAIALIIFTLFCGRKMSLHISKDVLPAFIFQAIILIDMLLRGNETLVIFLEYLMFFCFSFTFMNKIKWVSWVQKFIYIIGVFYAITVLIQAIAPESFNNLVSPLFPEQYQGALSSLYQQGYYAGLTSQVAIVSCYIIGAAFVCTGRIFSKKEQKKKCILDMIIIFMLVLSMLFTGKRATLVFFIVTVIAFFYFSAKTATKKLKFLLAASLVVAVVYSIGLPLIESFGEGVLPTLARLISFSDTSGYFGNGRGYYWGLGAEIIKAHPFTGVGWENYITVSGAKFNCHNIYVQMFAELGIPLGLIVIVLMVVVWNNTRKFMQHCIRACDNEKTLGIVSSFLVQTFILLYGFVGNPLYDCEYIAIYLMSIVIYVSMRTSKLQVGN